MSQTAKSSHSDVLARASWWRRIGYQSKQAELVLYFLGLSGLLLWEGFALPWPLERAALVIHFLVSLAFVPVFLLPFWLSHRGLLATSRKPFLRLTGRVIEGLILAAFISGFVLTFFGRRGDLPGEAAYWAHLLPAVPLMLLVYIHAKRWSMVKSLKWLAVLALALGAIAALAYPALAAPNKAANESGSLILDKAGERLYSANFEAGSVSWIERGSGKRLGEITLGGNIRRVALNGDESILAATDSERNRVIFIDPDKEKILEEVATGPRPFGILYDARNDLFWVALFEGHRLLALRPGEGIIHNLEVAETPRGLALLSDGRLLISHAMIGEISLYDTTVLPPKKLRTIKLHESQDPDEFVSQGVPRLLDDIAVSPDESEAWLPHLLWNFDHPFQFQSTIFPSVSVISLKPGAEMEVTERRKHLFKQINILEDGTKTRIVSNPHDAAFSADGKRVYVTLAGSEDLLVFDLARRSPLLDDSRSARRKGKQDQGGAKAVQIYRHIPGDNPRGLAVEGRDIFVQNAMSLDLVKLDSGGKSAFARVKLKDERFAELVGQDPLAPALRSGLRLFHNGNSDDFPDNPMAGDFWMSCQSCHVDGFNFTNGYLFRDSPRDKYENAIVGHRDLGKMVAGDFVGDYLQIIRHTQGGMGGGTTLPTTPDKTDPEIRRLMEELHTYVTAKGNLPLLSTWLRLDDARKFVHEGEWVNSAECASCHSEMFAQWADSLHRLMGDSNPYYQFMEDFAAQTEGEEFRQWCMGCHHPQGLLSGLKRTGLQPGHMFEKGGQSLFEALEQKLPDLDEGTGCLFCHRITKLEEARSQKAGGNASFTVNLKDREHYVFEKAENPVLHWIGDRQINAKPEVHAQSYSQSFYKDSELCAACHNEFAPGSGAVIVDTYGEWEASPYNAPGDPAKHRTCIDCHMHGDIARIGEDVPGTSTDGGEVKDNVVTHQFTGANHHLVGLRNDKLARMSIELLRSAAELETALTPEGKLNIRVRNVGAGHALPTGVADFRQLWLHVQVRDAHGALVFESGKLDENNAVPEDARMFRKVFGDEEGKPVVLAFWRYATMLEDTKIPAGGHRDEVFALPADLAYPLSAKTRLMFRIYPQWVTDAVQEKFPDLPDPQTVVMTEQTQTLEHP